MIEAKETLNVSINTSQSLNGNVNVGIQEYELPIASKDVLGGIKVGENLTIDENGTLNAQAGSNVDLTDYALKKDVPTKTSQLINDSGFLTEHPQYEESDPTVPAHVKAITEEQITKWDSGTGGSADVDLTDYALKSELPTKTSQLENDSNFINKIKTINGQTLEGEGNILIQGGSGGGVSYEVGDIYITTTNINPSLRFGGEWELIDKHYKEWSYYSSNVNEIAEFVTPNSNATVYAFGIVRGPHSVYIRYYFRNNGILDDSKKTVGTLQFEKFGIKNELYLGIYDIYAGSEEGIAMMNVSSSTGEMYCSDVIPKEGRNNNIPSNTQIRFEVEARMPKEYMLDEHCDKFFWKRIG